MDSKERNIQNLYREYGFFGVLSGIASTFLSIYAIRLGASSQDVGLLSSLPALVNTLFLIPAGRIVEGRRNALSVLVVSAFLMRFQYALLAAIPFLPEAVEVPGLLVVVALGAIPAAVVNVAFTTMFAAVIPEQDRARVVTGRNALFSLTSAVAAFLGGKLLDLLPLPHNYQVLFLMGFAFSVGSVYYLSRLIIPLTPSESQAEWASRLTLAQVRRFLATMQEARPFVRYSAASLLVHWGLYLCVPLYSLFWVHVLDASEGWIGLISTVQLVIMLIAYPLWRRVAERRGNRFVLLAGCSGVALYPIFTALCPSQEYLLIPTVVGGIFSPPVNVGLYNGMLEVVPAAHRPTHIGVYSAAMNVAVFLAPLVATGVLVPLAGLHGALILGAAMRLVGWLAAYALARPSVSWATGHLPGGA